MTSRSNLGTTLSSLTHLPSLLENAEGMAEVLDALRSRRSAAIGGAWGSAAALTAACLARHTLGSLVVVLPHLDDLDHWAEDLFSFTGQRPLVFPAWDAAEDALATRLKVIRQLPSALPATILLTTLPALMQPVPPPHRLQQHTRTLSVGDEVRFEDLIKWLVENGLTRREMVELPGEFSRRGGILDIFPLDADRPIRIEFFGDEITSMRRFAPDSQRSLGLEATVSITAMQSLLKNDSPQPSDDSTTATSAAVRKKKTDGKQPLLSGTVLQYLPASSWSVLVELEELVDQGKHFLERLADPRGHFTVEAIVQQLTDLPSITLTHMPTVSMEATCHLRIESVERFSGELNRVQQEIRQLTADARVLIACPHSGEQQRLQEIFQSSSEAQSIPLDRLQFVLGQVHRGFRLVDAELAVLSADELFRRETLPRQTTPTRVYESRAIDSFLDLNESDLVVHVMHGIARYRGMKPIENKGQLSDHLTLEFAEGTKLYVPADKIDLVQKYVGGGQSEPELSKLGGTLWQRRKEKVQQAVAELALDMLDLQARREAVPGVACPPDSEWQREFEAAFPYQETADQLRELTEIKSDMEKTRPMDRLLCGDVGFGKTELALRAAFKMIDFGKQVAVLVPTTVLAEQHYRTFRDRLAEYPFTVACLSRFRTGSEARQILKGLAGGSIDVAIGTHRLLSKDVQFHDLGLVIIDEEQRFGVEHKDRLKKLRHSVDVLTLTATPIPRTLHLALLGIRDIGNLETPPRDRLAVETRIHRFDGPLIRQAILRELNREGQVYFVNNRVYNIHALTAELKSLVPEARFVIGHGQMSEHELERAMMQFLNRQADVLVATTIIENGLDIRSANTIFINQADQYGLADLHQLRGRVGRYKHRAYCYLLIDPNRKLSPQAAKRLKALEEFSELGAGFKIAMRDLEIRGAGNILGTEQSGHIAAVGYELYCQLLENAVRRLKNQAPRDRMEVTIELPLPALIPRDYLPGPKQRIELYRRLSRIRKRERIDDLRQELVDRFGPLPEAVEQLLQLQDLRILASRWEVATIHVENKDLVLGYRQRSKIDKLANLSQGRLRVVDAQSAYYRLRTESERQPTNMVQMLKLLLQNQPG